MAAKVALITGANTGLGLEIVKALLKSPQPYKVFLGTRSVDNGEAAKKQLLVEVPESKSSIDTVQIDVASDESVEAAFEAVKAKTDRIDTLIANAGVSLDMAVIAGKLGRREAWHQMADVNIAGSHIFSHTFAPLLIKSADPRLIFITSGTSSIEEAARGLPYTAPKYEPGWPKEEKWSFTGYRTIKTAVNMLTVEWSRILKPDNVKVFAISPGFLATNLAGATPEQLRSMGAQEPSFGAEFVRDVVEGKRDADAGKVLRKTGIQPW